MAALAAGRAPPKLSSRPAPTRLSQVSSATNRLGQWAPYFAWGAGVVAYIIAVANRSSFGVAGLLAAERFHTSATVLSLFVVVQLSLYALMQLPAGMALDLWGPRRMIATGVALMALGQFAMAFAPTVSLAIAARVLIGTGDATIFVSVVRLVWNWFPVNRAPIFTQLTGIFGQVGQIISAVPFAAALRTGGWTPAFTTLAAAGVAITFFCLAAVRNSPRTAPVATPSSGLAGLGGALRNPGTWLGFFCHMMGGVSSTVFMLMWGVPFMVQGLGYAPATASSLLTTFAFASVVAGPLIGQITSRRPSSRPWVVLIMGTIIALMWVVLLLPANPVPVWVTVIAAALFSAGGNASLIGLDLAASLNSPERRSSVQGIANMGGFAAAVISMFAIGNVLDWHAGTTGLGLGPVYGDYRVAMAVMFLPLTIGALGILLTRRAALAHPGAATQLLPVRSR